MVLLGREILYLVEKFQTVIVVGQTGCGKTTRKYSTQEESDRNNPSYKHGMVEIPQYLDEAGWTTNGKQVACTQV